MQIALKPQNYGQQLMKMAIIHKNNEFLVRTLKHVSHYQETGRQWRTRNAHPWRTSSAPRALRYGYLSAVAHIQVRHGCVEIGVAHLLVRHRSLGWCATPGIFCGALPSGPLSFHSALQVQCATEGRPCAPQMYFLFFLISKPDYMQYRLYTILQQIYTQIQDIQLYI